MQSESQTYMENYNRLRDAAKKMQSMTEPDVDALIPLVEQGTQAYKACIERIEAVQKILGVGDAAPNS